MGRIKDNPAILYSGVASGDVFFITDIDVDTDKKIEAGELKKYVLENKTLGGSATTDIPTNASTGTFTNKTLTAPKINENVAVTATATELNKMAGCTASTAELNLTHTYASKIPYIANVTSDIQAQINGLSIDPLFLVHCYGSTFTADGTGNKIVTEDAILTALGLSTTAYYIDPTSMHGTCAGVSNGTYTVIDDTSASAPNVLVTWTTQTDGGTVHLDGIKVGGMTPASQYNIAFTFKLLATGV